LNLFPQIQNNSMIAAAGILAGAIEIYGFLRGRAGDDETAAVASEKLPGPVQSDVLQTINGSQTNISGKFECPVATGAGGEAVDMRNSSGTIFKSSGRVEQHIGDEITQIIQRETLPPPAIPSPPKDFTGRGEELEEILKAFDRGATITGLRGAGGIGKTALALVLADRLKSRFRDGQIFIKLEGTSPNPLKPVDAMVRVIRAFRGSDERLPEDQDELQGLYNSVLGDKQVLLLLDNAADDRQVLPLLPPKGSAVLVTSRYKFTLPGMPEPFSLDAMKPPEAEELLLRICPRIGGQAEELAGLCGYLPLALRAAGSLLAVKSDLCPSDYQEELRSERTRLERIGMEGVDLDVEACFDLSYSRLPTEMASVFHQLSVFPADFDAAAEEVVCQDEGHWHLSELVRWSLVEFDSATGRYHLHDLVRIFAALRLGAGEKREAEERHAEHYQTVLSASDELYQQGADGVLVGLALFDREWSNIQAGWAWAERNMADSSAAASLCSSYPEEAFYVLDLRLRPKEMIRWLETAVDAARQLRARGAEEAALGNLGNAYVALGESRKAIRYYEQSMAIARVIEDRRGQGGLLGNLGNAYARLGEPRKAIEHNQQSLTIAREMGDRRSEGKSLGSMGMVYHELDEPRKAIEYYVQALKISREIGDMRDEGILLGNLGLAYAALGESRKAIEYYDQALNIARKIGDRRSEVNSLGNLGNAYAALGDSRKAIEHNQQALAIAREIGYRVGEGASLGNLGNTYASLGEPRKAIEYFEQTLKITQEMGDRNGEATTLWNMSLALDDLNKRTEAVKLAGDALAIYEQIESPRAERVRRKLAKWQK
jgi:tetratricopeptide (TPR) repeat protein